MANKTGWTDRAYDAVYAWSNHAERGKAEKILLDHGLDDVVARLREAKNMGDWYRITKEAAEAVGPRGVERGAMRAQQQLATMVRR